MPAIEVTAPEARRGISWIRGEIKDNAFEIFKTQDELFNKWNDAIEEICENTKCLQTHVITEQVPNQVEYEYVDLIDTASRILQFKKVKIIDSMGKVIKEPRYATEEVFNQIRSEHHPHPKHSYSTPHFYTFDKNFFYLWKPYDTKGYRIDMYCVRIPSPGERVWYDRDPVDIIKAKYLKHSLHGAVYKIIAPRRDLQKMIDPIFYEKEFIKYKTINTTLPSTENPVGHFNELNLS